MARARAVSVLFYAINGRGLGHLTRLLAIARAARELLDALGVTSDFQFVTTSEASSLAEDFPVYKLPSKTALGRLRPLRERHIQHAKLLVSNLVAAQNPDLLVIDTVPYGAYQELAFLRSYARATAYVYRHQNARSANSELVQRHLELFDRIVVPDDASLAAEYPLPRSARERVAFVGTIHGFDRARAWSRDRVRAYFGVPHDKRLVYVSAGGGGDGRTTLDALVRAASSDDRNVVLAGYGPLHRGECIYAPNVIPLLEAGASRYFGGVDAALSAAGYNSYEELLAARVPTLFFAQDKGLDRQDLRIARGLESAAHGELPKEAAPELVRALLDDLLTGALGQRVRAALAARPASDGALLAAVELLAVCASLADSPIERSALYEVAAWRRDATPLSCAEFARHARAYSSWRTLAATAPELAAERDLHVSRWWSARTGGDDPIQAGAELAALREHFAMTDESWLALTSAFASHPATRSQSEKRLELVDALRALETTELGARLAELARSETRGALREAVLSLARDAEAITSGAAQ